MEYKDTIKEENWKRKYLKSIDGNTALKLFSEFMPEKHINEEFNKSLIVKDLPFNKAKIISKTKVRNRKGLVYQYLEGPTLKDLMKSEIDPGKHMSYLTTLHKDILNIKAPNQCESYKKIIRPRILKPRTDNVLITKEEKKEALRILDGLPEGDNLCHGSLKPSNIIISGEEAYAIDLMTISKGPALYDIARTYYNLDKRHKVKSAEDLERRMAFAALYLEEMGTSLEEIKDYLFLVKLIKKE
jgi:hypothetical protein